MGEWQSGSTLLAAFCLLSLDHGLGNALSPSTSFSARISLWGCASPWCTRAASMSWLCAMKPSQSPAEDKGQSRGFKVTLPYPKLRLLRAVWSTELPQKPGDSSHELFLLWDWKCHLDTVMCMGNGNCADGMLQLIPSGRVHWNGFRKGRVKRETKSLRGKGTLFYF